MRRRFQGPERPDALTARPASARAAARATRCRGPLAARSTLARRSAVLLVVTLALRLWGIKQGLPYSYNVDEATHFVPRAVGFFGHDLNPNYFLNPPGVLVPAVHRVRAVVRERGRGRPRLHDRPDGRVRRRARRRGGARHAVGVAHLPGRPRGCSGPHRRAPRGGDLRRSRSCRSSTATWRSTTCPTLAPVALSLYGIGGRAATRPHARLRDRRPRHRARGGDQVHGRDHARVPRLRGVRVRRRGGGRRAPSRCGRLALALADRAGGVRDREPVLGARFLGVPRRAHPAGVGRRRRRSGQARRRPRAAGSRTTCGRSRGGSAGCPALAAVGGAVLLLRRRRWAMALVLLPAPIAFIVFMGDQQRFFGRWLMPIFPIVAMLGAYAAVELVRWLARGPRVRRVPAPLAGALRWPSCCSRRASSTVVHNDAVLSRPDTRNLTRAWMVANVPAGAQGRDRAGRARQLDRRRRPLARLDAERRALVLRSHLAADRRRRAGNLLPAGAAAVRRDRPVRADAAPAAARRVRQGGATAGSSSARCRPAARSPTPGAVPPAIAYYAALAQRAADVPRHPVRQRRPLGAVQLRLVDRLLPVEYRLPGPEMSVYRLAGGRCGSV